MGGVTAVSRLAGFVRVLVIAAVLGTTYLGNTFQASNSVSNVLFELLAAGALSAVLVPTFVTLVDAGDDAEADRLANGLLGYALVAMGVITVLGIAFAPLLARLLSSGAPNAHVGAEQRHLATFLLWFFMPQVMLYAFGAIATGLLYAKRQFAITAAAPIGSSVVMIVCFIAFRVLAGPAPGFDLTLAEKLLLAVAGTGRRASRSSGSSWSPRGAPASRCGRAGTAAIRRSSRFSRLAVWGVLLHSGAAMLLGASIVAGNGVAGGVVAYQVAFMFFLAPYAVLAQPIHTAILPEMANDVAAGDLDAFAHSIRWALDRMALLVIPVSAGLVAIALPMMRLVAFGSATKTGPALLAAGHGVAGARALPLRRVPACSRAATTRSATAARRRSSRSAPRSSASSSMVVGSQVTHGAALVAALGIGHTTAYLIGDDRARHRLPAPDRAVDRAEPAADLDRDRRRDRVRRVDRAARARPERPARDDRVPRGRRRRRVPACTRWRCAAGGGRPA